MASERHLAESARVTKEAARLKAENEKLLHDLRLRGDGATQTQVRQVDYPARDQPKPRMPSAESPQRTANVRE